MIDWVNSRDKLEPIVADCRSCTEVLEKLQLRKAGANYRTLRKYLEMFKIDTTHFDPNWMKISKITKPLSDDVVFVENSTVQRSVVKHKIITRDLIPYVCAQCAIVDTWNGKPIILHLEHKNGIANDHRLSNLEFLCPNCHSQTESYAGRNTKGDYKDTKARKLRKERADAKCKFIEDRIEQIVNSGVVIGEWGWLSKLSKILNITEQPLGRWIKKHAPAIVKMAEDYKNFREVDMSSLNASCVELLVG
jgi:hypothetical protein